MPEDGVEVAYILLRVKQQMVDEVIAQLMAMPFVKEASAIIGGYDIIVKVAHEETFTAAYEVMQGLDKVEGIMEIHVLPAIKRR